MVPFAFWQTVLALVLLPTLLCGCGSDRMRLKDGQETGSGQAAAGNQAATRGQGEQHAKQKTQQAHPTTSRRTQDDQGGEREVDDLRAPKRDKQIEQLSEMSAVTPPRSGTAAAAQAVPTEHKNASLTSASGRYNSPVQPAAKEFKEKEYFHLGEFKTSSSSLPYFLTTVGFLLVDELKTLRRSTIPAMLSSLRKKACGMSATCPSSDFHSLTLERATMKNIYKDFRERTSSLHTEDVDDILLGRLFKLIFDKYYNNSSAAPSPDEAAVIKETSQWTVKTWGDELREAEKAKRQEKAREIVKRACRFVAAAFDPNCLQLAVRGLLCVGLPIEAAAISLLDPSGPTYEILEIVNTYLKSSENKADRLGRLLYEALTCNAYREELFSELSAAGTGYGTEDDLTTTFSVNGSGALLCTSLTDRVNLLNAAAIAYTAMDKLPEDAPLTQRFISSFATTRNGLDACILLVGDIYRLISKLDKDNIPCLIEPIDCHFPSDQHGVMRSAFRTAKDMKALESSLENMWKRLQVHELHKRLSAPFHLLFTIISIVTGRKELSDGDKVLSVSEAFTKAEIRNRHRAKVLFQLSDGYMSPMDTTPLSVIKRHLAHEAHGCDPTGSYMLSAKREHAGCDFVSTLIPAAGSPMRVKQDENSADSVPTSSYPSTARNTDEDWLINFDDDKASNSSTRSIQSPKKRLYPTVFDAFTAFGLSGTDSEKTEDSLKSQELSMESQKEAHVDAPFPAGLLHGTDSDSSEVSFHQVEAMSSVTHAEQLYDHSTMEVNQKTCEATTRKILDSPGTPEETKTRLTEDTTIAGSSLDEIDAHPDWVAALSTNCNTLTDVFEKHILKSICSAPPGATVDKASLAQSAPQELYVGYSGRTRANVVVSKETVTSKINKKLIELGKMGFLIPDNSVKTAKKQYALSGKSAAVVEVTLGDETRVVLQMDHK